MPRHRVDMAVTVDSEQTFYAGYARDLSAGGIFVDTTIMHPVGTRFRLSLHLDDGIERVVRGVGEVRWAREAKSDDPTSPMGVGIRFVELEGDGAERIERFLGSGFAGPPSRREPQDVS